MTEAADIKAALLLGHAHCSEDLQAIRSRVATMLDEPGRTYCGTVAEQLAEAMVAAYIRGRAEGRIDLLTERAS